MGEACLLTSLGSNKLHPSDEAFWNRAIGNLIELKASVKRAGKVPWRVRVEKVEERTVRK